MSLSDLEFFLRTVETVAGESRPDRVNLSLFEVDLSQTLSRTAFENCVCVKRKTFDTDPAIQLVSMPESTVNW